MPVKLVVLAGARPNFMKVAPLWAALRPDPDFQLILVHTGQHYDHGMSGQFFDDLGLPNPDHHLEAGSGSHAHQTAEILKRVEPVLVQHQPRAVVVVGDVNSTIAGALAAKKLGIDVVHVEAGLRSGDRSMPEEINRIATDAISDLFFVTEESGRANLAREGVSPDRVHLVGNLMIDSLRCHLEEALHSEIRQRLMPQGGDYGLVTLHRPANVDDNSKLTEILDALNRIASEVPLYWPVHPRSRARLNGNFPHSDRLHLIEPLGYLDFLSLQAQSSIVLTDSGGIQEETTVLGVPCLTIRENTERPVTIECGTNRLAGTTSRSILKAWDESKSNSRKGRIPPLWDGKAGERIHAVFREEYVAAGGR
jgi:UDP-N-acetylglucosamine 2-epimerase (non-hydrolysing)